MTSTSLRGRRVVVTGAAGALGSATAAALREGGAEVVGLDLAGANVTRCDVRDGASVTEAVRQARERMGGIDAVVHFAGIGMPSSAGAEPTEAAQRTLDINLLGPWRVTAACIDELVENRGRAVFVASQLAYATLPFATAYTVSKRGLCAYADSLRAEYGTHVGVTTIYPGYIRTPIHDASVAAGLSLDSATREQSAGDVVATVLQALTAVRAPRDLACTRWAAFELAASRHLPRTVEAVIRARLRRDLARGRHRAAPLAAAMRARLGFPDTSPPTMEERIA